MFSVLFHCFQTPERERERGTQFTWGVVFRPPHSKALSLRISCPIRRDAFSAESTDVSPSSDPGGASARGAVRLGMARAWAS